MTEHRAAEAVQVSGAPSHEDLSWHAIDWQAVHSNVRRLQARIVKATQEGRWGKVQALQRLLTRSFSGKALAVRRVTENPGNRTPGVDGVVWNTPEKKAAAIRALRQRGYRPQPLRRVYIPKSHGKLRPLGIPVMGCRAMQALYLLALDPVAETTADPNSYGFRRERSVADAMEACFCDLAKSTSSQWIFEGDIRACFDRISHEWLLTHIPMERVILQKWLKAGYMDHRILYPTEAGTPQGGIASPVLANLALDGLERRLREQYPRHGTGRSRGEKAKVNLVRFADDFIITGSSRELLEQEVQPMVEEFMRERGLELSSEKTTITHIEEGFDFLGQHVRKYPNGKVLMTPAHKNVQAFLADIRSMVKARKSVTAGDLIFALNPKIRGWAAFHRHVTSKATFHKVDHEIFLATWHWALRRHPNKSRRWIRNKYFRTIEGRSWCFVGTVLEKTGAMGEVWLFHAGRMPIRRHVKVRAEANPYDPAWEVYFEERLGVKMEANLRSKRTLLALWMEQGGKCPICRQKITHLTGWHNHHLVQRVYGGGEEMSNRMLLHPECHRQVHSQGLSVVKPRPSQGVRKA